MTESEALIKLEARVRTVISDKRDAMEWEKDYYKNTTPDDPYRNDHFKKYKELFREIQTLKVVLIWIDDIKEEYEEEEP